jgi:hypothetical protein
MQIAIGQGNPRLGEREEKGGSYETFRLDQQSMGIGTHRGAHCSIVHDAQERCS